MSIIKNVFSITWKIIKPIATLGIPMIIKSITKKKNINNEALNTAINEAIDIGINEIDKAVEKNNKKEEKK